ncbi:unnamed protein product [Ixodes pacificus]
MALSRKDVEELKPWIDRTVEKFLGFNEPTLVTAAVSCLSNGYDKRKTTDKLSSLLDDAKAAKLSEQLFETIEDLKVKQKMKKKKEDDSADQRKTRFSEGVALSQPGQPSPGQLTAIQIKEMMANAQRMIEERKRALGVSEMSGNDDDTLSPGLGAAPVAPLSVGESRNRIAELTAQIQAKLGGRPGFVGALPSAGGAPSPAMPTPLILNAEGRTVDLSGKEKGEAADRVTTAHSLKGVLRRYFELHQLAVRPDLSRRIIFVSFPRLSIDASGLNRRSRRLKGHEAHRNKALEKFRAWSHFQHASPWGFAAGGREGGSHEEKEALTWRPSCFLPQKEGEIPDVEWWDTFIIKGESVIDSVVNSNVKFEDLLEGVTNLVEHPIQMKAPTATVKPVLLPVYLTKKERKKLRRQNRREAWKEKQEKIRLGLEPPPEPKGGCPRCPQLGRSQTDARKQFGSSLRVQPQTSHRVAHEEANASRKLTTEQRREKKVKKLKEDTSRGVHVSVYRLLSLTNPAKKFKVEMNAKQLFLTGCVVLYRNVNLVVVEGGPRQQKKYRRLMMGRIKWAEDQASADGCE